MGEAPERRLDLEVGRRGETVRVRIRDTGRGIPASARETIANGRTSARTDGGRGLHRSLEILRRWRGDLILVQSAPGRGTTFAVDLPAAAGAAPEAGRGEA
jgi:signal transduction histidine kinase